MADGNHAAQYYIFMKWFKSNHLALFSKYQLHITLPAENGKITAAMDYVDPADKKKLQAIIDEYYATVAD